MLEHGAYTMLLDRYYASEEPIKPADIYRITHAHSEAEKLAVDAVLTEFFVLTDGAFRKNRVEQELAEARAMVENARANGKKGGRPRKPRITQPVSSGVPRNNPELTQVGTQTKANQQPTTNNQRNDKNTLASPDGFAAFWQAYPKKADKPAALKAWGKLGHVNGLLPAMLAAVDRQKTGRQWREGIVPHPATWLTGRRWEDEDEGPRGMSDAELIAFVEKG